MNQQHFYLATEGIGPGTTHYTIATLGMRVNISVTPVVVPQRQSGGGSYNIPDFNRYVVKVEVVYKNKKWVQEKEVGAQGLQRLEKVIASYKSSSQIFNNIKVNVGFVSAKIINLINIHIRKKRN